MTIKNLKVLVTLAFFAIHGVCEFVKPSMPISAQSVLYPQHFDLEEVVLLDGPMKTSLVTNAEVLLEYDADRLMCPFIREAGLSSNKKSKYYNWTSKHPSFGNWGQSDWSLEGHVGGHYISALAMSIAACKGDSELSAIVSQLSARLDYCLAIMKDCQNAYDNNTEGMYGFIGGQPVTQIWKGLYAGDPGQFYKYGGWVPFYCQHKVLAGLRDAYVYTGSDLAKEMFRKMADWSVNVVAKLSTETMQSVLNSEHGGMNEIIADAYKIFGAAKYLAAAKKYSHQTMIDGMQNLSTTFLNSRHANTQVPKYIGFARIAQLQKSAANYRKAALNFWTDVAENRTVCIGGNSVDEHFLTQSNYGNYISRPDGPETCNSNNMLKLSEDLFDDTHDSKYADFYENTMYNHILATQDPTTGGYVYFTTLRPQGYKIYSQVNQGMWCCVGTGMENHAKYGHFIYTHQNDTVFINLFTASELNNERFGLRQETQFPYEEKTTLTITKAGKYTIAVRNPSWTGKTGYTKYTQNWKVGDKIEVNLPMQLRFEECPGLKEYVAFKYGPILLAAKTGANDLQNEYAGEGRMDHAPGSRATEKSIITSPLLVCERDTLLNLIKKTAPMEFAIDLSNIKGNWQGAKSLKLQPFFDTHHDRYIIYWYQQNEADYATSNLGKQEAERAKLESRTLDFVGTGEQQSEAGHQAKYSSGSTKGSYRGEFYRDAKAGEYIQYTLTIPESARKNEFLAIHSPYSIMCRFITADKGRAATIYIDNRQVGEITIPSSYSTSDDNGFFNIEYEIPKSIFLDGNGKMKSEVVFKIVASNTTLCPGLYYVRLLTDYVKETARTDYEFHADEWANTGDGGRVSQSNIKYDTKSNTIIVKAGRGNNNVCLNMTQEKYRIGTDYRYFVIQATNVRTTEGSTYLWWFNGINHGTSVPPTVTKTSTDGTTFFWELAQSGLDERCTAPQYSFSQGNSVFGLTSTTGTSVIKYIGFSKDTELPANIVYTGNTANHKTDTVYNLMGQPVTSTAAPGSIIIKNGKKILLK